jgi:multisubunit Na+/H+ antiporter MnhB subunit
MKKDSGFIEILVLVIIFVIVLIYFGKNPIDIWNQIKPIFEYAFDLFLRLLDWLVVTITGLWQNR